MFDQVDPEMRPAGIGPPFTGHFRVTVDVPRGLHPFQPGPNPIVTPGKPLVATDRAMAAANSKVDLNLELRRNVYDPSGREVAVVPAESNQANGEGPSSATNGTGSKDGGLKLIEEALAEPSKIRHCASCSIDCTRLRYHSTKLPDNTHPPGRNWPTPDLCPNCYADAKFPNSMTSADFVKLEDASYVQLADRDAPWSDSEIFLLLEGLELYDEDWELIADHVGRTREQCAMKFLHLDIDDKYVENEWSANGNRSSVAAVLGGGRPPFSTVDNPLLSVLGHLASQATVENAAASVGKSADELRRKLREQVEKTTTTTTADERSELANGGTDRDAGGDDDDDDDDVDVDVVGTVKRDDSMDIDHHDEVVPSSSNAVAIQRPIGSTSKIGDISAAALTLVSTRARDVKKQEESRIVRLATNALNVSLQKHELKQRQFEDLECILQAERLELERARQQLYLDRLAFKKRVGDVQSALQTATDTGGEHGLRIAQAATTQFITNERLGLRNPTAQSDPLLPQPTENNVVVNPTGISDSSPSVVPSAVAAGAPPLQQTTSTATGPQPPSESTDYKHIDL